MIPIAYAIQECQRTTDVGSIPCNIISSWKPTGNCEDYGLTIYNSSGDIQQNLTWGDYPPICNATFNISQVGSYYFNSTVENGVINVVGDSKLISAIIILIPMLMAIVLIIASLSMSDRHSVLKIYLFLISLLMFYVSLHLAMINVVKFMDFPELQDLIGSTVYWFAILFGGIILYFMIYLLYIMFRTMAQSKDERIEY